MLNLDFDEKCINFVVRISSDLHRVALFVLKRWKSDISSFYIRKTSFEERKTTLEEGFSKTYVQKI